MKVEMGGGGCVTEGGNATGVTISGMGGIALGRASTGLVGTTVTYSSGHRWIHTPSGPLALCVTQLIFRQMEPTRSQSSTRSSSTEYGDII